ncbi:unnamed protein product, partial [marine sediment metagenome]
LLLKLSYTSWNFAFFLPNLAAGWQDEQGFSFKFGCPFLLT